MSIQYIMGLPEADDVAKLHTFFRLCPYFRGEHHIEEIMFRESVSRAVVDSIVSTFSRVLVTAVF